MGQATEHYDGGQCLSISLPTNTRYDDGDCIVYSRRLQPSQKEHQSNFCTRAVTNLFVAWHRQTPLHVNRGQASKKRPLSSSIYTIEDVSPRLDLDNMNNKKNTHFTTYYDFTLRSSLVKPNSSSPWPSVHVNFSHSKRRNTEQCPTAMQSLDDVEQCLKEISPNVQSLSHQNDDDAENQHRRKRHQCQKRSYPSTHSTSFYPFCLRLNHLGEHQEKERTLSLNRFAHQMLPLNRFFTLGSQPADHRLRLRGGVLASFDLSCPPQFPDNWDPMADVSQGQETMFPIQCVNTVDDIPPPTDFTYVTRSIDFGGVQFPTQLQLRIRSKRQDGSVVFPFCNGCISPEEAESLGRVPRLEPQDCYKISGVVDREGRRRCLGDSVKLSDADNTIICHCCETSCFCDVSVCTNRLPPSQLPHPLELRRKDNRSWGLFCKRFIARDTRVMDVVGEVIDQHRMKGRYLRECRHRRSVRPISPNYFEVFPPNHPNIIRYPVDTPGEELRACLDLTMFSNAARFLSVEENPNLELVTVLNGNDLPRIIYRATRNIVRGEELTIKTPAELRAIEKMAKEEEAFWGKTEATGESRTKSETHLNESREKIKDQKIEMYDRVKDDSGCEGRTLRDRTVSTKSKKVKLEFSHTKKEIIDID